MAIQEQMKDYQGKLFFDMWWSHRWIGMCVGDTPAEARKMALASQPDVQDMVLTPYYGRNTSTETYEALTGNKDKTKKFA